MFWVSLIHLFWGEDLSRDETGGDILSEKGGRYKRNVYAINLIASILILADAKLGGASLFSVQLPESPGRETIAWSILFLILAHQWAQLIYYGWSDYRNWHMSVLANIQMRPRLIYFGCPIGTKTTYADNVVMCVVTNIEFTESVIKYSLKNLDNPGNINTINLYTSVRTTVKASLNMFWSLDFGIPVLWGIWVFIAIITK